MAIVTYTLFVIFGISLLKNADAQAKHPQDNNFNVIKSFETLRENVENLQANIEIQADILSNLVAQVKTQAALLDNLMTKVENQATLFNNLLIKVQTISNEVAKLSAHVRNSASSCIVEGIIAGMSKGLVVIPFDSRDETTISDADITGLAFDWSARKVYWIESNEKIKRSNLDGTSVELLISGSRLRGLAVDPITGNFYYGILRPNQEIRVCSSSGKNCAVIASGADVLGDIYDMALYPFEGLMFWSNYKTNKTITRANMDGTDARVIISEDVDIYGIYVDELSRRISWANDDMIVSHDLNGNNRKVLLNNATLGPSDVAVDGDTLYAGNWMGQSVSSITQDNILSIAANTTGPVRHIDFYGRNKVHSRANPCQNSSCPNLCVLNRDWFTCL